MKQAVKEHAPRRAPRRRLERARRRDALRRHRLRRRPAARTSVVEALRELDEKRGTARQPPLLPRRPAGRLRDDRQRARRAAGRGGLDAADRREAVRPRPRVGAAAERDPAARTSPRTRSSGSTTTSARRRSRTCSRCGSRTGSSSRSGTASSSTTSRSPSPSRWGSRAAPAFYEQAGAIRDIFQNHLLQLVALTAMEPPIDFTADSVRNEKVKVLRSLHTPGPKSVVRGQYGRGFVEGEEVPGYREEEGVAPRLDDRDVRRREALRRQLALGRHAVLRPRGQAARPARDDDRDPVPAGAAPAVRRDRGRRAAPERAPDPRPAGRGRLARDRREGARARACRSGPCTWTSSTAAPSAPGCRRRTSG